MLFNSEVTHADPLQTKLFKRVFSSHGSPGLLTNKMFEQAPCWFSFLHSWSKSMSWFPRCSTLTGQLLLSSGTQQARYAAPQVPSPSSRFLCCG